MRLLSALLWLLLLLSAAAAAAALDSQGSPSGFETELGIDTSHATSNNAADYEYYQIPADTSTVGITKRYTPVSRKVLSVEDSESFPMPEKAMQESSSSSTVHKRDIPIFKENPSTRDLPDEEIESSSIELDKRKNAKKQYGQKFKYDPALIFMGLGKRKAQYDPALKFMGLGKRQPSDNPLQDLNSIEKRQSKYDPAMQYMGLGKRQPSDNPLEDLNSIEKRQSKYDPAMQYMGLGKRQPSYNPLQDLNSIEKRRSKYDPAMQYMGLGKRQPSDDPSIQFTSLEKRQSNYDPAMQYMGLGKRQSQFDPALRYMGLGKRKSKYPAMQYMGLGKRQSQFDPALRYMGLGKRKSKFDPAIKYMGLGKRQSQFDPALRYMGLGKRQSKFDPAMQYMGLGKRQSQFDPALRYMGLGKRQSKYDPAMQYMGLGKRQSQFDPALQYMGLGKREASYIPDNTLTELGKKLEFDPDLKYADIGKRDFNQSIVDSSFSIFPFNINFKEPKNQSNDCKKLKTPNPPQNQEGVEDDIKLQAKSKVHRSKHSSANNTRRIISKQQGLLNRNGGGFNFELSKNNITIQKFKKDTSKNRGRKFKRGHKHSFLKSMGLEKRAFGYDPVLRHMGYGKKEKIRIRIESLGYDPSFKHMGFKKRNYGMVKFYANNYDPTMEHIWLGKNNNIIENSRDVFKDNEMSKNIDKDIIVTSKSEHYLKRKKRSDDILPNGFSARDTKGGNNFKSNLGIKNMKSGKQSKDLNFSDYDRIKLFSKYGPVLWYTSFGKKSDAPNNHLPLNFDPVIQNRRQEKRHKYKGFLSFSSIDPFLPFIGKGKRIKRSYFLKTYSRDINTNFVNLRETGERRKISRTLSSLGSASTYMTLKKKNDQTDLVSSFSRNITSNFPRLRKRSTNDEYPRTSNNDSTFANTGHFKRGKDNKNSQSHCSYNSAMNFMGLGNRKKGNKNQKNLHNLDFSSHIKGARKRLSKINKNSSFSKETIESEGFKKVNDLKFEQQLVSNPSSNFKRDSIIRDKNKNAQIHFSENDFKKDRDNNETFRDFFKNKYFQINGSLISKPFHDLNTKVSSNIPNSKFDNKVSNQRVNQQKRKNINFGCGNKCKQTSRRKRDLNYENFPENFPIVNLDLAEQKELNSLAYELDNHELHKRDRDHRPKYNPGWIFIGLGKRALQNPIKKRYYESSNAQNHLLLHYYRFLKNLKEELSNELRPVIKYKTPKKILSLERTVNRH